MLYVHACRYNRHSNRLEDFQRAWWYEWDCSGMNKDRFPEPLAELGGYWDPEEALGQADRYEEEYRAWTRRKSHLKSGSKVVVSNYGRKQQDGSAALGETSRILSSTDYRVEWEAVRMPWKWLLWLSPWRSNSDNSKDLHAWRATQPSASGILRCNGPQKNDCDPGSGGLTAPLNQISKLHACRYCW